MFAPSFMLFVSLIFRCKVEVFPQHDDSEVCEFISSSCCGQSLMHCFAIIDAGNSDFFRGEYVSFIVEVCCLMGITPC